MKQEYRPSVLIVDDEQSILETLGILLKNEGFEPHTALGGISGVEQLRALKPDIVLSDVRMPGITGIDVLNAARAQSKETQVILMTAQATLQSAMQAVNAGAFYYILKPFRNDELLAILRRASENRALRAEVRSLKHELAKQNGSPNGKTPQDPGRSSLPAFITQHADTKPTLDVIERSYITWVVDSVDGNKTKAAEILGIDPSTLYRKLVRFAEPAEQSSGA
jgi:DNA-binding NtrC family response regulator